MPSYNEDVAVNLENSETINNGKTRSGSGSGRNERKNNKGTAYKNNNNAIVEHSDELV